MKFFNMGVFPRRYLVIDFKYAKLSIYKKRNDESTVKEILFRDVQEYKDIEWTGSKSVTQWCYPFFLKTTSRNYILVAQTEQDKFLWLDAFDYLIPSTALLQ